MTLAKGDGVEVITRLWCPPTADEFPVQRRADHQRVVVAGARLVSVQHQDPPRSRSRADPVRHNYERAAASGEGTFGSGLGDRVEMAGGFVEDGHRSRRQV